MTLSKKRAWPKALFPIVSEVSVSLVWYSPDGVLGLSWGSPLWAHTKPVLAGKCVSG